MQSIFILASIIIANMATPVLAAPGQSSAPLVGCIIQAIGADRRPGPEVRIATPGRALYNTRSSPPAQIVISVDENCNKKTFGITVPETRAPASLQFSLRGYRLRKESDAEKKQSSGWHQLANINIK